MLLITDKEKGTLYNAVYSKIEEKAMGINSKADLFRFTIDMLSKLPHFQWTGIYEYDSPKEMLTLFPYYIGLPTEHTQIPKGKGVCGTAIAKNQDIVVEDVQQLDNYLACSVGTKSEIVVLIKDQEQIYGQIDIDSDEAGAFNDYDRTWLEKIAHILANKCRGLI
jgi:GAF domain-containing protein